MIRLGVLALPLAGLFQGVASTLGFDGVFEGERVGGILAVTLAIFGFIALFAYLVNTRGERWASYAMIMSIAGIALAPSVFNATIRFEFLDHLYIVILLLGFLLYSVGAVLFGVAVWRSGSLPKWAGILYPVHALPLLVGSLLALDSPGSFETGTILSIVGAVLLVLGGGWIALSIRRRPSAGEVGAEAEPRAS